MKNIVLLFALISCCAPGLGLAQDTQPSPARIEAAEVRDAHTSAAENSSRPEILDTHVSADSVTALPKTAPASQSPKWAEWRDEEKTSTSQVGFKMLEGLGICLGIFLVGVHFYKRYALKGQAATIRRLQVIEKLPVSSKAAVLLIQAEGKKYLIGVGGERISLLHAEGGEQGFDKKVLEEICNEEIKLSA